MDKLSVIIPARNEELLRKTIECVLEAAVEDVEVIAPPKRSDLALYRPCWSASCHQPSGQNSHRQVHDEAGCPL
jgi:hypothetical protein